MLTMSRACNASEQRVVVGSNATNTTTTWKESYRSSDSVESSEDSDNSSTNSSLNGSSSSGGSNNNNNRQNNTHLQTPIGCITTHCVSAVIRPERKMPPIDPLQFVKIQKNELSKKAVEQIKLAEEVKITKEKIKEVEEEWQNNLMNWKSKRKLTKNNSEDEALPRNPNRKTKTFSEILNEKAKSGARIGYNLQKYIDPDLEELDQQQQQSTNENFLGSKDAVDVSSSEERATSDSSNSENEPNMETSKESKKFSSSSQQQRQQNQQQSPTNLDRLLNATQNNYNNNNDDDVGGAGDCNDGKSSVITRNGLGEVVVYNTSLLEEFSVRSDCDINQQQHQQQHQKFVETLENPTESKMKSNANGLVNNNSNNNARNIMTSGSPKSFSHNNNDNQRNQESHQNYHQQQQQKVHVPINDWNSSQNSNSNLVSNVQQNVSQKHPGSFDVDDFGTTNSQPQNSSFEIDDDEELDEELEKLRIDQERSFKAKLHTFEILAKQEEEAARRAAEANRKRQLNRAKLAAERSKSLSNINSAPQAKPVLEASNSVSSSSLQQQNNQQQQRSLNSQSKPVNRTNTNNANSNEEDSYYKIYKNAPTNSVIYNFKDKQHQQQQPGTNINPSSPGFEHPIKLNNEKSQKIQQSKQPIIQNTHNNINKNNNDNNSKLVNQTDINNVQEQLPITKSDHSHQSMPQTQSISASQHPQQQQQHTNNIYENVSTITNQSNHQRIIKNVSKMETPMSPNETLVIADSDAIRNASQKLLQQQQQIYQNQPIPPTLLKQPQQQQQQQSLNLHAGLPYVPPTSDHYTNVANPSHQLNYGYTHNEMMMISDVEKKSHPPLLRGYPVSDDVGLPPIQITKSVQSEEQQQQQQHPVYQNQIMIQQPTQGYHVYDNSYPNPETMLIQRRNEELVSPYPTPDHHQQPFQPLSQTQPPPPPQHPSNMNPYINSQYLYYPKPYTGSNGSIPLKPVAKQMQPAASQQPLQPSNAVRVPQQQQQQQPMMSQQQNLNRYGANGYNPNHWVIQEAELRQSTQRLQQQQLQHPIPPPVSIPAPIPTPVPMPPPSQTPTSTIPTTVNNNKNCPGYLSVSGKKKCSKCGDELGKGCAAMVVESLSLYYHINCFRCSVCNVQLGNGTVGTDVRVRNNKLHCQNCYSNDEAGLKFSRV